MSERRPALLTNHAYVLLAVARQPDLRVRDIAEQVGVTERAVQLLLRQLEESGYLKIHKAGRRNRYVLAGAHPHGEARLVGELAQVFAG